MFEDKTYENLLQSVLDNAPDGIDTRPGSIFYDAVSGILIEVAKLYTDLELIVGMTSVMTASGDALETKASEYGVTRNPATAAKYHVTFEGITPQTGERFYTNGRYFILNETSDGMMYLEAEETGEVGNEVYAGTAAVPVNNIDGLVSAKFGVIYESGTDAENDDNLRMRIQEKIAGPAENGNKQHYKTWCESVEGVGRARIYPLWNGPNTVKAILIDSVGKPLSDAKVAEVQQYIDPAEKGYSVTVNDREYVVGDGLGDGAANIGAHFTAAAAIGITVNVNFNAILKNGYTTETASAEAAEVIEGYLKELALYNGNAADVIVRITSIGALLSNLDSIIDYSDLTVNGDIVNISPGEDGVPVLGEVTIN